MTTMTKTKLNWRLKDLPTGDEIATLVQQEVITKDEARELLFKDQEERDTDTEIKALKEQIKFLEQVVHNLSRGRTTTTFIPALQPYWYSTGTLVGKTYTTSTSGSLGAVTYNANSIN